tara:strand:+ start:6152 stop:7648 length:1497 start_codon:yes stop_codon:yes gene_type:complete
MNKDTVKLNALDKAIYFFSPESALKRAHARQVFELSYDAANPGNARKTASGGYDTRSSESWTNQRDRIKLIWEARDLAKNFSFVKSILLKEAMYVCGKIKYQAQTGDPDMDRVYEKYWKDWESRADITNRHVFRQIVQLAHMNMRCDGEVGLALRPQGPEMKLQSIEADRLGNPNEGLRVNDEYYYQGIQVNDLGQPTSYRIFKRTRMGQYIEPEEVSPEQFIHYYDPMRSDQYHGVTAFDTALPHARDLYDLLKYEKLAVKWGSSHSGVITKEQKDVSKWASEEKASDGTSYEKIEPGKIVRTLPGEAIQMFQTSVRPSPTFNGFVETLIREMANGLNLPYSFVWDMASLGGVSARIELAMAQRAFRRSQNLLEEQVLNRIKDAVLSRAISFNIIPAHPNWRECKWQFPAHITADQGYTTQSDLAMLGQGIKTASGIIGEMGEDYEEVVEGLAKEVQIMYQVSQRTGIPMELIQQRLPNPTSLLAMMNEGMSGEPQG